MALKTISKNKVVKNFSYLTLGSIVSQLLMLFTVIKITNVLSTDDYGTYSFIIAQGMLLITISELGTKSIIIRTISREPYQTKDLIHNGIKLRILSMIATIILYFGYNYFLGELTPTQTLLLGVYALSTSLFYLFEHIFIGYQKMYFPSIIKSGMNLLYFLIVIVLPIQFFTINVLVVSYIIITVIQAILYLSLLQKNDLIIGNKKTFIDSSRKLIVDSKPYFLLMLLSLPVLHLANNFLDINSSKEEVGYYNLAKKLMGPVQLVITFSLTAIFPNISAMFLNNRKKFHRLVSAGMGIFIGLTALFCFIFTMFSKDIILLVFSEKYLPAIRVIQLQVWFVFLNGINHFITVIFGAANLEKHITRLALVNLAISAPLIYYGSRFGAMGISFGFIVSAALYEIYIWYQFKKHLTIQIDNERLSWLLGLLLFAISYIMSEAQFYQKSIVTLAFGGVYLSFAYKKIRALTTRSA